MYIDNASMLMVTDPGRFDVVVMENQFGDIVSEIAAGIAGGLGIAPSADIGPDHAVFQPSHGTAPDIAGKGVANPVAAILSAALLFDWLAERKSRPRLPHRRGRDPDRGRRRAARRAAHARPRRHGRHRRRREGGRGGPMSAGGSDEFDYVIVGAGAAGSVLADRLTRGPGRHRLRAGGRAARPQPLDPHPGRVHQDAVRPVLHLAVQDRADREHRRPRHRHHAGPHARRLAAASTA